MSNPSKRSHHELSILHVIAEALNREVDLHSSLAVALGQIVELFNLRTGWIFLMDEDTGEPYLAAYQNLPPALEEPSDAMHGGCLCLDLYEEGTLDKASNINIITCSRLKWLVDGTDGLRYHASIPLYDQATKLGMLNVLSADWHKLSSDDLHLLYTVGELVSMAIQRARLFAKSVELGMLNERNRLAREIHDTLAQGLTAIALQLETADVLAENPANLPQIQQLIQQTLHLTRHNLEEVRRSVLDLRAVPLEGLTLAEALAKMADDLTHSTLLEVMFDGTSANISLPTRVAAGLYRIAQEALNNILHHAEAHHAQIQLSMHSTQVRLLIEDDGKGFDLQQMPPQRYGLIGLQERAKLLGGKFHLQTTPDAGTRIEVWVPLNRDLEDD
jgi:two-component system, NarL family, sensor kinase